MLTPLDIQQKKFKNGLGYDKRDVQAFFDEVSKSYGELYRSNAELKERVITLTDTVQHYKATENELSKRVMLAEKNSEESKTNAEKTAKAIENEALSRAHDIVKEAEAKKQKLEEEILELTAKYAEYKTNFNSLIRKMRRYLDDNDFDPNAATTVANSGYKGQNEDSGAGAAFVDVNSSSSGTGSGLGGGGGSKLSMANKQSNSSNVYGSTLGGAGIDPFADIKFTD